jgi:hypothetical protein
MIKFMRKHNRKLLAIFTAGLLVVWLGSQALENMLKPDTSKQTIGKAFGQNFDRRDRLNANVRTEVLASMGMPWNRPWSFGLSNLPIKPIDQLTWFLLDREARRCGIEVPPREVDRFLLAWKMPGRVLEQIRDRHSISIDRIKDCIADFMRIGRVGNLAAAAIKVSQPEVAHFVRDTRETVAVRMSILRADAFADPNSRPDAAAMEKQFYQYRNDLPGTTRYGYGYRWPDRIRVEYVVTDMDKIEKAIKISRDDAMNFWRDHRKDYTKQIPVASAPTSGPATKAATRPTTTTGTVASAPTTSTKPATETQIKTFNEAYEQVVSDMKKQQSPALAEKLIRELSQQVMEPWFDIKPDPNTGYKSSPAGVDAPNYLEKIAADVCRRNDLPPEALRVVKPARWVTRTDATDLEGIGKARMEGQPSDEEQPTGFVDAVFHVQNLYTPPKGGHQAARGLSLFEMFNTPLRDTKEGAPNNYYMFRVVAAQKEHSPESIDEVKDQVRRDLIEQAGFERAGEQARKLQTLAASKGLEAAVKADAALAGRLGDKPVITPEPFARRRSFGQAAIQFGLPLTILTPIEELGVTGERKIAFMPMEMVADEYKAETEQFIEACFRLAPPTPTSGPATTAASRPAEPTTTVEMPRKHQWVVVEFVSIERVPVSEFSKIWRQAQALLQIERTVEFLKEWYDPEQVKKRAGYVPAREEFAEG